MSLEEDSRSDNLRLGNPIAHYTTLHKDSERRNVPQAMAVGLKVVHCPF